MDANMELNILDLEEVCFCQNEKQKDDSNKNDIMFSTLLDMEHIFVGKMKHFTHHYKKEAKWKGNHYHVDYFWRNGI